MVNNNIYLNNNNLIYYFIVYECNSKFNNFLTTIEDQLLYYINYN